MFNALKRMVCVLTGHSYRRVGHPGGRQGFYEVCKRCGHRNDDPPVSNWRAPGGMS